MIQFSTRHWSVWKRIQVAICVMGGTVFIFACGKSVLNLGNQASASPPAALQFSVQPNKTTVWTGSAADNRYQFGSWSSTATYYCRTGPLASVAGQSYLPCDGASGTGTTHVPSIAASTEGSYRTDFQVRDGGSVVHSESYRFYLHNSLAVAVSCPALHTDQQYFTFAQNYLPTPVAFDVTTNLEPPFIQLVYQPHLTSSGTQTLIFRTLRSSYAYNANSTLILLKRSYRSHLDNNCQIYARDGGNFCDAVVISATGMFVCLGDNGTTISLLGFHSHPVNFTRSFSTKYLTTETPRAYPSLYYILPD